MRDRLEIRSSTGLTSIIDEMLIVEGLVNRTETWSKTLGNRKKFRERIVKGAFDKALKAAERVDFLNEHTKTLLLASTANKTLTLWESQNGLEMKAQIVETGYGKDVYELIKSGLAKHMSFGFKVLKESWDRGLDGVYLRTIEELALTEVSVVRNPAYANSAIEARGIEVVEDLEIPNLEIPKIQEKVEERNMKNVNFIGSKTVENMGQGEKVNLNMKSYINDLGLKDKIFEQMTIKNCDEASGKAIFAKINSNFTIEEYVAEKGNYVTGVTTEEVEVLTAPITSDSKAKLSVVNTLTEEVKKEFFLTSLDEQIKFVSFNRLGSELNKIKATEVALTADAFMNFFSELNPKYLSNVYLATNETTYKMLVKLKDATGNQFVEFKRNLLEFKEDAFGDIRPYFNDVEIIIIPNLTQTVLFNPKCIGLAIGKLNELNKNVDTNERRLGIVGMNKVIANGFGIIDTNGIVAAKFLTPVK